MFHPEPESLFYVIAQMAKFLKEFSDFGNCPVFRHPKIRGHPQVLQEICLFDEVKKMDLLHQSKVFPSS